MKRCLSYFVIVAIAVGFAGCAGYDTRLTDTATQYIARVGQVVSLPSSPPHDNVSYWDGDGVSGKSRVKIDLGEQRAYFYKGGQLVGVSQVSTGREGYGTPGGSYSILEKTVDKRSTLYGDYVDAYGNVVKRDVDVRTDPKPPRTVFRGAPMPYWMRLTNSGIGMHAGFLPGYPASHGCIRMPKHMAQAFFRNVNKGTPVMVTH